MKTLIYGINFYPEVTGIGKFSGEMAFWFAEKGMKITVITTVPHYPQWKPLNNYNNFKYKIENIEIKNKNNQLDDGLLTIYRCPIWIPQKPTAFKRLLYWFSFFVSSFPIIIYEIFKNYKLIIAVTPPVFFTVHLLFLSLFTKSKKILHIQDFEVDAIFDMNLIKNVLLKKLILKIEFIILKNFDYISSISENMVQKIVSKKVSKNKVILFSNWVNTNQIFPMENNKRFKNKLKLDLSKFLILYSGNIGEKQGLDSLIDAAKILNKENNILFIISGEGSLKQSLINKTSDLSNILWLPLQPEKSLNEFLNIADVHVLPQRKGIRDLVMPSKLLGMLATGKPIIAMAEKETQVEKDLKNVSIITEPGDVSKLVNSIKFLYKNKKVCTKLGKLSRTLSYKWEKQTVLTNFFNYLNRM